MGLQKCFEAADLLDYRLWANQCSNLYNEYLITPPRIYCEEVHAVKAGGTRPGALYASQEDSPAGVSVINFVAACDQVCWPSWNVTRWTIDGAEGRKLRRVTLDGAAALSNDLIAVEPGGSLWWFSGYADAFQGGAVLLNSDTLAATSTKIAYADFGKTGIEDFAIDRASDRVFVRWLSNNVGQVSIHKLSTRELIADIWAPNKTNGIVLTNDGFIYLTDVYGWICVYDFDGNFYGAMKHPAPSGVKGGFSFGWDAYYKRLLYLPGTPCATDGASALRVQGFYPLPSTELLSAPIPLSVPRKNRPIYVFSHLTGIGGEPRGGRPVTIGGSAPATMARTDPDGDAVFQVTPQNAGQFTVEVKAE